MVNLMYYICPLLPTKTIEYIYLDNDYIKYQMLSVFSTIFGISGLAYGGYVKYIEDKKRQQQYKNVILSVHNGEQIDLYGNSIYPPRQIKNILKPEDLDFSSSSDENEDIKDIEDIDDVDFFQMKNVPL
jgi:hypothetical protein